jgi:hypothetical protein
MHEKARHRLLGFLSRLVSLRPGWILFLAVAIAVASVAVTFGKLRFQSNRNDLISKDLEWNQRFLRWADTFSGAADLIVVVDTYNRQGQPDPQVAQQATQLVDELGPRLRKSAWVTSASWGFETSQVSPKAIRLQPIDQFRQNLQEIAQVRPLLESPTPASLITQAATGLRGGASEMPVPQLQTQIQSFAGLIDGLTQRLATPAQTPVDLMAAIGVGPGTEAWQYLATENQRLLLIQITPRRDPASLNPYESAIADVRQKLADAAEDYPDVDFGLTGIEVVEADETDAATIDSTWTSILAAVLIATLLIIAFHSFRVPLLLMATLAIAIAWSFGFLTLVVGHLQVISVVFAVILLGLGVAFGIHVASRFELVRHLYPDSLGGFRQSLQDTFETVGPGVVTGAVTTAAAFCTTMLTDFIGVAEMGLIAAAGVILCLIAMFTVFPALLRIFKPGHKHVVPMEERFFHFFEERWVSPFVRHPKFTLAFAAFVTLLSFWAISQMRFNYNLLELLPKGVDSVQWQDRIVTDGEQSIYFAVSVVDSMEEARQRASELLALPSVQAVTGIGRLIPDDEAQKLAMLAELDQQIGSDVRRVLSQGAPATVPQAADDPSLIAQISVLNLGINAAMLQAPPELQPALARAAQSMNQFLAQARSLDETQRRNRLDALQRDYEAWRLQVASIIAAALDPSPLQVEDLPDEVMRPYVAGEGENRQFALEIHPKLPPGISDPLQPAFLGSYIKALEHVDPNVTGVIVQIYYSGTLIWTSYVKAGLYALLAVFALVWLDFRSVRDAGLTLVPVAVGFAVTFGAMYCLGVQINPANIIVLPLMFGIGVDSGVHILHRFRQDPTGRPLGLTGGTGKGITVTTFTTMIGFGSMLIARHRGIVSLGFVLMVGIGLTLLACWMVMPAWLELRVKRRERLRSAAH